MSGTELNQFRGLLCILSHTSLRAIVGTLVIHEGYPFCPSILLINNVNILTAQKLIKIIQNMKVKPGPFMTFILVMKGAFVGAAVIDISADELIDNYQ